MTREILIRSAEKTDANAMASLIERSARAIAGREHARVEVEAALRNGVWGLDRQLIEDGTYYLVFCGGDLAACGAWSFRRTLFGSDRGPGRNADVLDPAVDAARIRGFFVAPAFARRGFATMLLTCCERAARRAGFRSLELAATLSGEPLYCSAGYGAVERFRYAVGDGFSMEGVRMRKTLAESALEPEATRRLEVMA